MRKYEVINIKGPRRYTLIIKSHFTIVLFRFFWNQFKSYIGSFLYSTVVPVI